MSEDSNTGGRYDISWSTFAVLTEFQRDILIILSNGIEMKGLSVKDELEKYYENTIHHGRLYPNLDKLVDKNLVDKFELDNRSNGYRLTQTAEQLLENRLAWERAKSSSKKSAEPDDTQTGTGTDSDASSSLSEPDTEPDGETLSTTNEDLSSTEATADDSLLEDIRGDFEDDTW
jgi:DNA-binding PadR family transcriptional regulator